jgi:hypothetical protein
MRRPRVLLASTLTLLVGLDTTQLYAKMLVQVDGSGPQETSSTTSSNDVPQPQAWGGEPCLRGVCRPSFLIIGAGKCGTSSVYYYLQDHPQGLAYFSIGLGV